MQKGAGPSAAMDKANRDKMFPQGEGAVGKRQAYKKHHKNAHGNSLGGNPDAQKIMYIEEKKSPQWAAGYKVTFDFNKKVTRDIREKLLVPFLR